MSADKYVEPASSHNIEGSTSIPEPLDEKRDVESSDSAATDAPRRTARPWRRYPRATRMIVHGVTWLCFTAWWIVGLVLHRDLGWVVPFLLYLAVSLWILFQYAPISIVSRPMKLVWYRTIVFGVERIPTRLRIPLAAIGTLAVVLVGTFVSAESPSNTRIDRTVSFFGIAIFLSFMWATSRDHKRIAWRTVIVGVLMQFIVALFVLRTGVGYDIFNFISGLAQSLLGFARAGAAFLTDENESKSAWFLVSAVPALIFFTSFVQLLYHWRILQWIISRFAVFFFWCMGVSGAEAVVAAASPFVGQQESAILIKPFIAHLTDAEIHQVMSSGFSTIAGSVFVAYVAIGVNPEFLLSSCIMSIPASLAVSKLRYPETETSLTAGTTVVPEDNDDEKPANALHAIANGAWLGLRIAGMVVTTVLCIVAFIAFVDGLLSWWGHYWGIPNLTLELILGYICYPIAFLLGVSRDGDLLKVGQLIGVKIIANEFVAYSNLQHDPQYADLSPRSRLIATYALCGFGNLSSVGIQVGLLSRLAPSRAGSIARVAFSALGSGIVATLMTAAMAGLVAS